MSDEKSIPQATVKQRMGVFIKSINLIIALNTMTDINPVKDIPLDSFDL